VKFLWGSRHTSIFVAVRTPGPHWLNAYAVRFVNDKLIISCWWCQF